jgi:hypothetical protein
MPLPLPSEFEDFVSGASRGNALKNLMAQRRYNEAKAEYAPESLLAQAASQAAYANNIAPQYMAKMLQDAGIKGNLTDEQLANILQKVYNSGNNGNPLINTLNQRLLQRYQNLGQQHQNPLAWLFDKFKSMVHPEQNNNPLANGGQQSMPQQGGNVFNKPLAQQKPQSNNQSQPNEPPQGAAVDENGTIVDENGDSITPVTPDKAASLEAYNRGETPRSYQQNEAGYEQGVAQGKESGKLNAHVVNDIGKQNLALNAASTNLDAIIKDFNDPVFENMRARIPGFQKKQLSALAVLGTPEEKEKIGKFIGDIRQYAQATINSFRGPATGREFAFANDLKPTEDDNIDVIRGKALSLKELNKIAYQKNKIISQLMDTRNKNPMTLTDAVEEANKRVDVSKIEKEVNRLVHPQKIATIDDIKHMAKKHNKSPEEIKELLKAKGIKYEG